MADRAPEWNDDEDAPPSARHEGFAQGRSFHLHGMPHSRLGIASFVVSLLVALGVFAVGLIMVAAEELPEPFLDLQDSQKVGVGLCGGCALLALLGLGLGIAGILQANRQKAFGIIGVSLNVIFLLVAGLFALGILFD